MRKKPRLPWHDPERERKRKNWLRKLGIGLGNVILLVPRIFGIRLPVIEGSIKNDNNLYLNELNKMEGTKNILKSKTFWFNVIAGVFTVVQHQLLDSQVIDDQTALTIVTVGNLILRKLTKGAVTISQ